MAEHHDEPRAEPLRRELDAADLRGRHDVAGDADDEEVTEALVEDDLRGHARVRAPQHDRERLLPVGHGAAACPAAEDVHAAVVGHEAPVALLQPLEGFARADHVRIGMPLLPSGWVAAGATPLPSVNTMRKAMVSART